MTQREFHGRLAENPEFPGQRKKIVMIQCVESREEPRNYCSRVCCASALKHALQMKEQNPTIAVYVLYRDMMTYGFTETYYTRARKNDIGFIQYSLENKPRVEVSQGVVTVSVFEPIIGQTIEISTDLLVLATGVVPNLPADLAAAYGIDRDMDGFFQEAESKWRPVDALKEGVFACGLAHSPRSIAESIATAEAAAAAEVEASAEGEATAEELVDEVDETAGDGSDDDIFFTRWSDGAWDPVERIGQDDFQPDLQPLLGTDADGSLFVRWKGFVDGGYADYLSRWEGEAWSPEQRLNEQDAVLEAITEQLDAIEDPAEQPHTTSDPVMCTLQPVDADAHQKVVFVQELAPFVVEEGAVRLYGILDNHLGLLVSALKFDCTPEKVEAHEGGFAALPGKSHLRYAMRLDVLAGERLQDFLRHAEPAAWVQVFLRQEEAVRAVEVADRAGRFGQHVQREAAAFFDELMRIAMGMHGRHYLRGRVGYL